MSSKSPKCTIRRRLLVLFLTLTWLIFAALSSAMAHFSAILRAWARSDYIITNGSMVPITFANLMTNILVGMILVALSSALLSIFGVVLVAHPRLLRENSVAQYYHGGIQFVLGLSVLSIGGYVADGVHGYQTLFAEFEDRPRCFSYYPVMYYGAIGQAVYGSLTVIMTVVYVAL